LQEVEDRPGQRNHPNLARGEERDPLERDYVRNEGNASSLLIKSEEDDELLQPSFLRSRPYGYGHGGNVSVRVKRAGAQSFTFAVYSFGLSSCPLKFQGGSNRGGNTFRTRQP